MRKTIIAALYAATCMTPLSAHAGAFIQTSGPSQKLFGNPYYSCPVNVYVSNSGSDTTGNGSSAAPWATLQKANDSNLGAGTCVNVVPGTYSGVSLNNGGNLASSTGYLVYRCETLDACTVNGTAGINNNDAFTSWATNGAANYVIIDGFFMQGNGTVYGVGVGFTGATSGGVGVFGSHHDWVLNSVVTGFGQAGIAWANGDYSYTLHNLVYSNAFAPSCDNGAQGSGIGDNVPLDIGFQYPNYVPTADDKTNPNPLIGSFVVGSSWFHKVISFNTVYNNYLTPCKSGGFNVGDSDGNNIILDTFNTGNGNNVNYLDQTLISYNTVYNAGGAGIHIFYSEYATVANNTSYNEHLDPTQEGGGSIDDNFGYGNTFINNISIGYPAANADNQTSCDFSTGPAGKFNNAYSGGLTPGQQVDVWSNNVSQIRGGYNSCWAAWGVDQPTAEDTMWNGDVFSCATNLCATDPMFSNVGTKGTGTQSTQPKGVNFALSAGSPAIGEGTLQSYLPVTSVDAGSCYHTVTPCPRDNAVNN